MNSGYLQSIRICVEWYSARKKTVARRRGQDFRVLGPGHERHHSRSQTWLGSLLPIPRPQRRISILTLYEFYHVADGVMISMIERRERERWLADNGIIALGPHKHLEKSFRSIVGKDFTPPGPVDCFLAADCLARRCAFVTNNIRHFEQVDGLRLVQASNP
jgi:predicted nucleic acid-binding protein